MDYHYDSTSSAAFNLITLSADTHSLVSLRCKPTLTALPPELLSRVGHNLSLCEYSCLSRTSKRIHGHLFRPSEIVLFLKTRYRLSIESGSIIIFAYLANMQMKAPLLLEKIFDDFFADSALHQQEEYLIKQQQRQQRELLSHNTYLLNQSITGPTELNDSAIALQRMNAVHSHKSAEQARKQAKWDAVRMLGVLYALDKTHVGPSSSTNALVLSGASDVVDPPRDVSSTTPEGSTPISPKVSPSSSTSSETSLASSPPPPPLLSPPTSNRARARTSNASLHRGQPLFGRSRSRSLERLDGDPYHPGSDFDSYMLRHAFPKRSLRKWPSTLQHDACYSHPGSPYALNYRQDEACTSFSSSTSFYPFSFASVGLPYASSSSPSSSSSLCASGSKSPPRSKSPRLSKEPQRLKSPTVRFSPKQDIRRRRSKAQEATIGHRRTLSLFGTPDQEYNGRVMEEEDNYHFDRNSSMDPLSDEETRLPDVRDRYPPSGSVAEGKRIAGRFSTEPISVPRSNPEKPNSSSSSSSSNNPWSSRLSKSKRHFKDDVEMGTGGMAPGMESSSFDRSLHPYPRTIVRGRQMSPPPSHTRTLAAPSFSSVTASLEKKVAKSGQQILNRDDKIAFLTRYTDRMHTKLQALGIKDWGQKDIQTKKTYQLMIQHNNKTGEKDLVEFYLGRYGGAPPSDEHTETVAPVLPTEV
ncbi:hypothetical protein BG005_006196 [Podila minutissima]|nr:hypothetical protein BG005_006196 [Podila minutissima]